VPSHAPESARVWVALATVFGNEPARCIVSAVSPRHLGWAHRLYLALDTVLWNQYRMIQLSVVCCGPTVPLLWRVLQNTQNCHGGIQSTNRY